MISVKTIEHGSAEYRQAVALRLDVLRRPLGLDFSENELAEESDQIHLAAFEDSNLVGTLALVLLDNGRIKMRQVAVAPAFQRRGIGKELIRAAEDAALVHGRLLMELHARSNVVDRTFSLFPIRVTCAFCASLF